jgi:hypothetical protein
MRIYKYSILVLFRASKAKNCIHYFKKILNGLLLFYEINLIKLIPAAASTPTGPCPSMTRCPSFYS